MAEHSLTAPTLALIRRKIPEPPTLTAIQKIVQPPRGHEGRPLTAAFVVI